MKYSDLFTIFYSGCMKSRKKKNLGTLFQLDEGGHTIFL